VNYEHNSTTSYTRKSLNCRKACTEAMRRTNKQEITEKTLMEVKNLVSVEMCIEIVEQFLSFKSKSL